VDLSLEYNDDLRAFTFMQETSVDLGLGYNDQFGYFYFHDI